MRQKANPHLRGIRQNVRDAARILANIFPEALERDMALQILSRAITRAARVAPASWGTSLFQKRLRLNVGRGAVLQFYPDQLVFIVTGELYNALPKKERAVFRVNGEYSFVTNAIEGSLRSKSLEKYALFEPAHADLIERAAQNRKICFWDYAHSPSVVQLLRERGFDVPDPDYSKATASRRLDPTALLDLDEIDHVTSEGRRTLRNHLVIERDPALAPKKKDKVMAATGRLACEVCSFDFERVYGSVGHAFAEVHQIQPLGSSNTERQVRLSDLAVVCSNCHRMLHRGNPVFELAELRDRLASTSRSAPNVRALVA